MNNFFIFRMTIYKDSFFIKDIYKLSILKLIIKMKNYYFIKIRKILE